MTIDFPDDENGRALRDMAAEGDNLGRERDIDFSLLFSDRSAAEAFCGMMSEEGYDIGLEKWTAETREERPADKPVDLNQGKWDVRVTRYMLPDHGAITAFEAELQAFALPLGGVNDGWGCFQVED